MSLHDPDKYINLLKSQFYVQYRRMVERDMHPVHIAFALINLDVQIYGTPWNKCQDCGQPYIIGVDSGSNDFCSDKCLNKTLEYLNDPSWKL